MVTSKKAPVKRAYQSALRDEQARQTRRAIVAAAAELFVRHGYAGTTVDAIAEGAGVSRKTVFTSVGGKAEALKLAIDWANVGDDEPVPMLERPHVQAAMREPDARVLLSLFAHDQPPFFERTAPLYDAARQAAGTDPAIAALVDDLDRQRTVGLGALATQLDQRGALRPDLDHAAARDILCAMAEPSTYQWLVSRLGWSPQRYADWYADALTRLLIDAKYRPPRRRRADATG